MVIKMLFTILKYDAKIGEQVELFLKYFIAYGTNLETFVLARSEFGYRYVIVKCPVPLCIYFLFNQIQCANVLLRMLLHLLQLLPQMIHISVDV